MLLVVATILFRPSHLMLTAHHDRTVNTMVVCDNSSNLQSKDGKKKVDVIVTTTDTPAKYNSGKLIASQVDDK